MRRNYNPHHKPYQNYYHDDRYYNNNNYDGYSNYNNNYYGKRGNNNYNYNNNNNNYYNNRSNQNSNYNYSNRNDKFNNSNYKNNYNRNNPQYQPYKRVEEVEIVDKKEKKKYDKNEIDDYVKKINETIEPSKLKSFCLEDEDTIKVSENECAINTNLMIVDISLAIKGPEEELAYLKHPNYISLIRRGNTLLEEYKWDEYKEDYSLLNSFLIRKGMKKFIDLPDNFYREKTEEELNEEKEEKEKNEENKKEEEEEKPIDKYTLNFDLNE